MTLAVMVRVVPTRIMRTQGSKPSGGSIPSLFYLTAFPLVCLSLGTVRLAAQELRIEQFSSREDGRLEVSATGDPSAYFRLLQGSTIEQINEVAGLSLEGHVISRLPITGPQAFFRLQKVPRADSFDTDQDGLSDVFELSMGLDPFLADSNPDSDGDGWPDEAEVTAGSDPNDPSSRPSLTLLAYPASRVVLPAAPAADALDPGFVHAQPAFQIVLPTAVQHDGSSFGLVDAKPAVLVTLPVVPQTTSLGLGAFIARPIATIVRPGLPEADIILPGLVLGQPPISIEFESP
jgi:hypothetical protein